MVPVKTLLEPAFHAMPVMEQDKLLMIQWI